jgi:hypothetical protein
MDNYDLILTHRSIISIPSDLLQLVFTLTWYINTFYIQLQVIHHPLVSMMVPHFHVSMLHVQHVAVFMYIGGVGLIHIG